MLPWNSLDSLIWYLATLWSCAAKVCTSLSVGQLKVHCIIWAWQSVESAEMLAQLLPRAAGQDDLALAKPLSVSREGPDLGDGGATGVETFGAWRTAWDREASQLPLVSWDPLEQDMSKMCKMGQKGKRHYKTIKRVLWERLITSVEMQWQM